MKVPCKNIPTYDYDKREWTTTSFNNQIEFGKFLVEQCFKVPGKYNFHKDRISKWNEAGRYWTKHKRYIHYAEGTPEYYDFWDDQELKSRLGVLWKQGDEWWYTTRDYYFLINFCPIVNKEKGYLETFADVRDGQYHMMLYEKIAECYHLHSCVLKRRQFLYSFCHVAKTINYLWFENRKRLKWFASDDSFIDDVNGSWSILNQYKTHLNNHTDWYRGFSPDRGGEIQQRQQVKFNNRWEWEGNESSVVAKTLKRDPKLGVGGPTYWAWYEEGGIAPTADITLQFMEPALRSGLERVGSFCIGGSVGDLDECKPLENFIKDPGKYGFFAVPTDLFDDTGIEHQCGLFIPAQYGMPEATDEHGNSLPELALELLNKAENEGFKAGEYGKAVDEPAWKELPTEQYILRKSQNPKTIKEAFAWRKVAFFNVLRIERRQKAIKLLMENHQLTPEKGLLYEDQNGEIKLKKLSDFPDYDRPVEVEFPVNPKMPDKRGCVTIFERPIDESNLYFAGVDSVEVGITETSNSIFSVHIYKRGHKKITIKPNGDQVTEHVRGKIVATYRGRFTNPEDHNEQGLLLLRMYKALAACERNKPNFITYCRRKNYGNLIARKSQLPFDKDLDVTGGKNDEFGIWSDSAGKLLNIMKNTLFEYGDAEVDTIHEKTNDDSIGKVVKTIRGYDLIDDYWLLEELKLWNPEDNFDAFISAALALILGISRELDYEKVTTEIEKSDKPKRNNKPNKPTSLLQSSFTIKKSLLSY